MGKIYEKEKDGTDMNMRPDFPYVIAVPPKDGPAVSVSGAPWTGLVCGFLSSTHMLELVFGCVSGLQNLLQTQNCRFPADTGHVRDA